MLLFHFLLIGVLSTHTDNWAVLVGTSRFWFNYRHIANVLGIYHILKQNGLSDDRIILMLPEDVACNPRNKYPAQVFNHNSHALNLFHDIEIDYKGYEVTVDNFLRVLLDRHSKEVPKHKRLRSDGNSNILVYITGHGGDEFVKFQDSTEITAADVADAITQMELTSRFNEVFFVLDSCQASTFFQRIKTKGVITAASSSLKESSYSHTNDYDIGVSVIDRFTYFTLDYFQKVEENWSESYLQDLFDSYDPGKLNANPKFTDTSKRGIKKTLLSDFFGKNLVIDFAFEKFSSNSKPKERDSKMWKELKVKDHETSSRRTFKNEVLYLVILVVFLIILYKILR